MKKVYVDDTKIKKGIKSNEDVEELQEDLYKLYEWARNNNMRFNGSKYQVMRYGANEDNKSDTNYFTNDTSEIINRYETLRDLWVILTFDAFFYSHIDKVVKKLDKKLAGS